MGGHNAAEYVSDLLMYNLGKIIIMPFFKKLLFLPFRLKFPYSMNPDLSSENLHQIADTMQAFWQTVVYSFLEASMVKSPLMMCTFLILQLVHICRRLPVSQWRQLDQYLGFWDGGNTYVFSIQCCRFVVSFLYFSFIFLKLEISLLTQ